MREAPLSPVAQRLERLRALQTLAPDSPRRFDSRAVVPAIAVIIVAALITGLVVAVLVIRPAERPAPLTPDQQLSEAQQKAGFRVHTVQARGATLVRAANTARSDPRLPLPSQGVELVYAVDPVNGNPTHVVDVYEFRDPTPNAPLVTSVTKPGITEQQIGGLNVLTWAAPNGSGAVQIEFKTADGLLIFAMPDMNRPLPRGTIQELVAALR